MFACKHGGRPGMAFQRLRDHSANAVSEPQLLLLLLLLLPLLLLILLLLDQNAKGLQNVSKKTVASATTDPAYIKRTGRGGRLGRRWILSSRWFCYLPVASVQSTTN